MVGRKIEAGQLAASWGMTTPIQSSPSVEEHRACCLKDQTEEVGSGVVSHRSSIISRTWTATKIELLGTISSSCVLMAHGQIRVHLSVCQQMGHRLGGSLWEGRDHLGYGGGVHRHLEYILDLPTSNQSGQVLRVLCQGRVGQWGNQEKGNHQR
jgi:hypothetical protein